jgi:hypothetical protein
MFVEPQYFGEKDLDDPVLEKGLNDLEPWSSRLRADLPSGWSGATLLKASAPFRFTPERHIFDEPSLRVTAIRLPETSLEPLGYEAPLLSRLRMLYARLLPGTIRNPLSAEWSEVAERPAVLDRLSDRPGGRLAGFSLATELTSDEGLVVLGSAPVDRYQALEHVAIPLATRAHPIEDGLKWALPSGWYGSEELQLTTETLQAFVKLEPLSPGTSLKAWTDEVFGRAPFLRDLRSLADREVAVSGLDEARMQRFDWQPSGGLDRIITTVATGMAGSHGFSFVLEVPMRGNSDELFVVPDEILGGIEVRG